MENEQSVVVFEAKMAVAESERLHYRVTNPFNNKQTELKRGTDFGVIPKTKRPSLYKAGAENICMLYGLMQRYHIDTSHLIRHMDATGKPCPRPFVSLRADGNAQNDHEWQVFKLMCGQLADGEPISGRLTR